MPTEHEGDESPGTRHSAAREHRFASRFKVSAIHRLAEEHLHPLGHTGVPPPKTEPTDDKSANQTPGPE